jgi:hypothetical protein
MNPEVEGKVLEAADSFTNLLGDMMTIYRKLGDCQAMFDWVVEYKEDKDGNLYYPNRDTFYKEMISITKMIAADRMKQTDLSKAPHTPNLNNEVNIVLRDSSVNELHGPI